MKARQYPRVNCSGLVAKLRYGDKFFEAPVTSISRAGLRLRGLKLPAASGSIQLLDTEMGGAIVLAERKGVVIEHSGSTTGFLFTEPIGLDVQQLLVKHQKQHAMRAAERDEKQVNDEISNIQACRTQIFIRTLMGLAAGAITLSIMAASAQQQEMWRIAVAVGGFVTFGLFNVAVFAIIEKARAVNLRKGYLAALAALTSRDELPPDYPGWSQMRMCLMDCGLRRKVRACSRGIVYTKTRSNACRDIGETDAKLLCEAKNIFSGLTDSFTSLCSGIYTAVYAGLVVGAAYSIKPLVSPWWDIHYAGRLAVIAGSMAITPVLCKGWKGAVWLVLVITFIITGFLKPTPQIAGLTVLLATGFCLGCLAWYLMRQVFEIQRGKYSVEVCAFAWQEAIKSCRPLPAAPKALTPFVPPTSWAKYVRNFYVWLLSDGRA